MHTLLLCWLLALAPGQALPEEPQEVRVACVGASVTRGAKLPDREKNCYPAQLDRLMGPGWDVRNFGTNGCTILKKSAETGGGLPYADQRDCARALAFQPQVVVIEMGGNDAQPELWKNYKGEFKNDFQDLIGRFAALPSQPKILLCLPSPLIPKGNTPRVRIMEEEILPLIRELAEEEGLPLIDAHSPFAGRADLFPDRVHPNVEGAGLIAKAVHQVLRGTPLLPLVDLAGDRKRQVLVDREPGQYLGHPTTVLLQDQKTLLCVYPKGHGKGGIVMKRSLDQGLTWSDRLPTPGSWATSKEVPTLFRVEDAAGKTRLLLFSGLYPIRLARSDDEGTTWTELEPIGHFGGIVAMACLERLKNRDLMALFHDDGRFFRADGKRTPGMRVYKTLSSDDGLTWSEPEVIASHEKAHLCEPGLIRSPDKKQLAVLLRENSRQLQSFVIFSEDEGLTWSEPRQVSADLTGDRHTGKYAPDGRLFISFRDTAQGSPTQGDWLGWVGTYDDLVRGNRGQYRVRLMDNQHRWDCAYPGVEVLPDGTFVCTTYGHWLKGEPPFIMSVRFTLAELDARL